VDRVQGSTRGKLVRGIRVVSGLPKRQTVTVQQGLVQGCDFQWERYGGKAGLVLEKQPRTARSLLVQRDQASQLRRGGSTAPEPPRERALIYGVLACGGVITSNNAPAIGRVKARSRGRGMAAEGRGGEGGGAEEGRGGAEEGQGRAEEQGQGRAWKAAGHVSCKCYAQDKNRTRRSGAQHQSDRRGLSHLQAARGKVCLEAKAKQQ
jgi:hypothetical protein